MRVKLGCGELRMLVRNVVDERSGAPLIPVFDSRPHIHKSVPGHLLVDAGELEGVREEDRVARSGVGILQPSRKCIVSTHRNRIVDRDLTALRRDIGHLVNRLNGPVRDRSEVTAFCGVQVVVSVSKSLSTAVIAKRSSMRRLDRFNSRNGERQS